MKFNKKEYLKNIANETMSIINSGFYINKNRGNVSIKDLTDRAIAGTELIKEVSINKCNKGDATSSKLHNVSIIHGSTIDKIIELRKQGIQGNIVALNFASAKHAGGGFLNGSVAQEESIARVSSLYPSLISKKEFYKYNMSINTPLYSDIMIYSPDVPIFRDNDCNLLLEPITCSFITSPAVNARTARKRGIKEADIRNVMEQRIGKIVELAYNKNPEAIVLGAYGCGVFANDTNMVAELFRKALKKVQTEANKEVNVIFAIYDKGNSILDVFKRKLEK